jgi:hypothetical protein
MVPAGKKIPHEDKCPKVTLIIPVGILNGKRFGADCWAF